MNHNKKSDPLMPTKYIHILPVEQASLAFIQIEQ